MSRADEETLEWLREIGQGSLSAFDRFYERYAGFVFRLSLKLTGNRMDAEDVCHDVFLEVLRKTEQFDPARGSVEAWLAVRTKSRSLDLLRRRQRQKQTSERHAGRETAVEPSPAEQVLSRLELETVRGALERLPGTQRKALHGVFYAGRTQREVAEEMKRPIGTVKSLVRYGLNNIRKQLSQLGPTDAPGGDGSS